MPRISRLIWCLTLCLLSLVLVSQGRSASAQDGARPAPGEPTTAAEIADAEDKDNTVEAIEGTQPPSESPTDTTDATTDEQTSLRDELAALRQELTARITRLETRLDEQVTRIDALEKSVAASAQTTTVNKPPAEADPEANSDESAARDAELANLKKELDQLRTDYKLLLSTVNEHTTIIEDHTESLAKQTEGLKSQNEQLTQTNETVAAVEQSQQDIEQRLLDAATSEGADRSALKIFGNMQADPNARGELFSNARYRLRIHNTTGSEQPLYVNGVQWTVRADEWTYVPIPLGPVTIHRPDAEPIEVAEDHVQWKSDNRGFYVDYDLERNQVSVPPEE